MLIGVEVPDALATLKLPTSVNARLQTLLDRQDEGVKLSDAEREEAEGLVDLTDVLSLLRRRAQCSSS